MTKIVSWNVNSLNVRQPQVLSYLESTTPDILGLQELKQTDEAVKRIEFEQAGWYIITHGQKTYNGVALISKIAPQNIRRGFPQDEADAQARAICADYGNLTVLNLYVPNGKAVGDEKYHYKLQWLDKLHHYLQQLQQENPNLIVIGDFNIAPHDIDVHDPKAWENKILCSQAERNALNNLHQLGLRDAFREKYPDQQQFSWWDYRMGGLRRNIGLRIDLTMIASTLTLKDAGIDMTPRHHERPSDHAPAWVDIAE